LAEEAKDLKDLDKSMDEMVSMSGKKKKRPKNKGTKPIPIQKR